MSNYCPLPQYLYKSQWVSKISYIRNGASESQIQLNIWPAKNRPVFGGVMTSPANPNSLDDVASAKQLHGAITAACGNNITSAADLKRLASSAITQAVFDMKGEAVFGLAAFAPQEKLMLVGSAGNLPVYGANLQGKLINSGAPLQPLQYIDSESTLPQGLGKGQMAVGNYKLEFYGLDPSLRFLIVLSPTLLIIYQQRMALFLESMLAPYIDGRAPNLDGQVKSVFNSLYKYFNEAPPHNLAAIIIERAITSEELIAAVPIKKH